ncbi:Dynein heavy chain 1, axonemal [Melia azedarach]|uniref:Dynein heavy chain 1, axonemal n=1 Tax=Melia azedarach TaxID=155640 RepID=A0ACC1YZA3_MELAZ|nr:Dynein heavy chain 1, axonemal [Melia azedarach]
MESNRKRRGFIKGNKLVMALYQTAKPSSTTVKYSSSGVLKPSQSSSVASVGLYSNNHVDHPPKQKQPSYITSDQSDHFCNRSSFNRSDDLYAYEESIDDMAASYISCVLERFRLERVD